MVIIYWLFGAGKGLTSEVLPELLQKTYRLVRIQLVVTCNTSKVREKNLGVFSLEKKWE